MLRQYLYHTTNTVQKIPENTTKKVIKQFLKKMPVNFFQHRTMTGIFIQKPKATFLDKYKPSSAASSNSVKTCRFLLCVILAQCLLSTTCVAAGLPGACSRQVPGGQVE